MQGIFGAVALATTPHFGPQIQSHKYDPHQHTQNASMYFITVVIKSLLTMTIRPTPGVTVYPAPHGAKLINRTHSNPKPLEVLRSSSYEDAKGFISFVQHSFPEQGFEGAGTNNGFVDTAIRAYSEHRHLRVRPDDVWCAILSQLSL